MDLFEILRGYVIDDAFILVPVLMLIGVVLKGTPKISDWIIPYVLGVIGIIFALLLTGVSIDSVIQGILVTGLAVYAHNLFKQGMLKEKS